MSTTDLEFPQHFRVTSALYVLPIGIAILATIGVMLTILSTTAPLTLASLAFLTIVYGWTAFRWLQLRSMQIQVHERHVLVRTGLFRAVSRNISIPQIVGINIDQRLGERMIGSGTVTIETTGTEVVTCRNIESVKALGRLLTYLKELGSPAAPP